MPMAPRVILFDVNETLLDLRVLDQRGPSGARDGRGAAEHHGHVLRDARIRTPR
jgi:hypothetical protein